MTYLSISQLKSSRSILLIYSFYAHLTLPSTLSRISSLYFKSCYTIHRSFLTFILLYFISPASNFVVSNSLVSPDAVTSFKRHHFSFVELESTSSPAVPRTCSFTPSQMSQMSRMSRMCRPNHTFTE